MSQFDDLLDEIDNATRPIGLTAEHTIHSIQDMAERNSKEDLVRGLRQCLTRYRTEITHYEGRNMTNVYEKDFFRFVQVQLANCEEALVYLGEHVDRYPVPLAIDG